MSSSAEIIRQIEGIEQREIAAIGSLDAMVLRSQPEIVAYAADWIDREVRRAVQDNPAVVAKLGQEGLARLKADVKTLQEKLPRIVEKLATNKSGWRHHNMPEDAGALYEVRDNMGPGAFVRNAIGPLGKILDKYELQVAPSMGHYNVWEPIGGSGEFRYKIHIPFNASKSALEGYEKAVKELLNIQIGLRRARAALASAKALEAFESA